MKSAPIGYIKKEQAAKVLGATVRSIDNWMKMKMIPYYKFGRSVFFKESDLLETIEKRKVENYIPPHEQPSSNNNR